LVFCGRRQLRDFGLSPVLTRAPYTPLFERCTARQRRLLGDLGHGFRPGDFFHAPEYQVTLLEVPMKRRSASPMDCCVACYWLMQSTGVCRLESMNVRNPHRMVVDETTATDATCMSQSAPAGGDLVGGLYGAGVRAVLRRAGEGECEMAPHEMDSREGSEPVVASIQDAWP